MTDSNTTLLLVRHGETDFNRNGIIQGHIDTPLNDRGRNETAALAGTLSTYATGAIYASPLQRAFETARILSNGKGPGIIRVPGLMEFNFGKWEGRNFNDIIAEYPEEWHTWKESWKNAEIPGGETFAAFTGRVLASVNEIIQTHEGETVLVATHGGPIRAILAHYICGDCVEGYWKFHIDNSSLTELEFHNYGAVLKKFNYRP